LLQCLPDLTKGHAPRHYQGGAERRGDQFHLAIKFGFEKQLKPGFRLKPA
jgi:hypothetical protein